MASEVESKAAFLLVIFQAVCLHLPGTSLIPEARGEFDVMFWTDRGISGKRWKEQRGGVFSVVLDVKCSRRLGAFWPWV